MPNRIIFNEDYSGELKTARQPGRYKGYLIADPDYFFNGKIKVIQEFDLLAVIGIVTEFQLLRICIHQPSRNDAVLIQPDSGEIAFQSGFNDIVRLVFFKPFKREQQTIDDRFVHKLGAADDTPFFHRVILKALSLLESVHIYRL